MSTIICTVCLLACDLRPEMSPTFVATILLLLLARAGAESGGCLTSCCLYCDGDTFCSFCNNIFRGKEECPCVTEEEKNAFKGKLKLKMLVVCRTNYVDKIIQSRKHLDWQDTVRCNSKSQKKVLKKMQSFMVKCSEKSPPTKSTSQPPAPPLQV